MEKKYILFQKQCAACRVGQLGILTQSILVFHTCLHFENFYSNTKSRGRRRLAPNSKSTPPPNEACAADVIKCDGICQCATCEDESECQNRIFRLISSPTLNELKPTGFWKVVRIPGNGTASVRVPFTSHGRVAISAMSVGTRGNNFDSIRLNVFYKWANPGIVFRFFVFSK